MGNQLISGYEPSLISGNTGAGAGIFGLVWFIISLVAAVIGCFVVYFMFVKKSEKPKQKFLVWLKSFLSFDTMLIEPMLKIGYAFCAIFLTLGSIAMWAVSGFGAFCGMLIGGNLTARLVYEAALMKVMIWKNTTEIKNKMK